jgi:hypothetical protein
MAVTVMCYSPAQQRFTEEIEKDVLLPRPLG